MMQDNNRDFDLQLRSMLEDAEIRPPKGAWKAISRRLDAADAAVSRSRGPVSPAFRWAGAALAFAAVALGVFISFPGSDGQVSLQRGALTADAVELVTPPMKRPSELGGAPVRKMYAASAADMETAEAQQAITMEEETAAGPETTAKPAATSRKAATPPSAEPAGDTGYGTYTADPFAALAMEEERENRKFGATFLYAKGAIGGNDPDFVSRSAGLSMAPGTSSSGIRELTESTYGIPLTLGLGVRFYLLPGFSIGTGVDYSMLTRTFTGTYKGPESDGSEVSGDIQHTIQYVGIPIDLYYDILSSDKIKFYVYGGGEAEFCVSNRFTVFSSPEIKCSEPVRKLQYSVGAGVGVEFRLADKLGLYLDPGVKYYFAGGQPKSIRTDKPLMFNFDAGLRFSL